MYLSCLRVAVGATGEAPTIGGRWLANRYRVHQRLCMAFPHAEKLAEDPDFLAPFAPAHFPLLRVGAEESKAVLGTEALAQVHAPRNRDGGFLFRIDPTRAGVQIIVQSAQRPNWSYAFSNFGGVLVGDPDVREFVPKLAVGQRLQFRLEANPTRKIDTKSAADGTRRHGRRVAVPATECVDWMRRFERSGGFSLEPQSVRLECSIVRARKSAQQEGGDGYFTARFDGVLTVTDPHAFQRKLFSGYGSAKAYGFGLMSVIPALQ